MRDLSSCRRGEQIPLLAQIVGIVDLFDAVTSSRPYRTAQSRDYPFNELRGECTRGRRNPRLVEPFIALCESGLV
jgi:cyclic di-GMP phosphodiesterase